MWCSGPSARMSKINPVWHRMLYSCTHMATVGVIKGLSSYVALWQLLVVIQLLGLFDSFGRLEVCAKCHHMVTRYTTNKWRLTIETRNRSDEEIRWAKDEFFFFSRFAYIKPTVRGTGDNIASLNRHRQSSTNLLPRDTSDCDQPPQALF